MTNLDIFTKACIEAMYFTETGDIDQPDPDTEMDEDMRLDLEADCRSFWHRTYPFIYAESDQNDTELAKQAGHDFWLTRNGHGAGFWDGDWPKYGDMLTSMSVRYGVFDVFENDGKICH